MRVIFNNIKLLLLKNGLSGRKILVKFPFTIRGIPYPFISERRGDSSACHERDFSLTQQRKKSSLELPQILVLLKTSVVG